MVELAGRQHVLHGLFSDQVYRAGFTPVEKKEGGFFNLKSFVKTVQSTGKRSRLLDFAR